MQQRPNAPIVMYSRLALLEDREQLLRQEALELESVEAELRRAPATSEATKLRLCLIEPLGSREPQVVCRIARLLRIVSSPTPLLRSSTCKGIDERRPQVTQPDISKTRKHVLVEDARVQLLSPRRELRRSVLPPRDCLRCGRGAQRAEGMIVRSRMSPHVSASVSPGRRPAYAKTLTSVAAPRRPEASRWPRMSSTRSGARGSTTRRRACDGFRTRAGLRCAAQPDRS